jgi:hypothetical protein
MLCHYGCISRGSSNSSSSGGSNVLCLDLQLTIYNWKVLFIYLLFNDAIYSSDSKESNERTSEQAIGKAVLVLVSYFEVLSGNLAGRTEETHKKLKPSSDSHSIYLIKKSLPAGLSSNCEQLFCLQFQCIFKDATYQNTWFVYCVFIRNVWNCVSKFITS